jgi:hypothetical protein
MGGARMGATMGSSEKTKDIAGLADVDSAVDAVRKSPSKVWRYKAGEGDGSRQTRVGPTAEDVQAATGLGDGKTIDVISQLGLHHAAIAGVDQKVDELCKDVKKIADKAIHKAKSRSKSKARSA